MTYNILSTIASRIAQKLSAVVDARQRFWESKIKSILGRLPDDHHKSLVAPETYEKLVFDRDCTENRCEATKKILENLIPANHLPGECCKGVFRSLLDVAKSCNLELETTDIPNQSDYHIDVEDFRRKFDAYIDIAQQIPPFNLSDLEWDVPDIQPARTRHPHEDMIDEVKGIVDQITFKGEELRAELSTAHRAREDVFNPSIMADWRSGRITNMESYDLVEELHKAIGLAMIGYQVNTILIKLERGEEVRDPQVTLDESKIESLRGPVQSETVRRKIDRFLFKVRQDIIKVNNLLSELCSQISTIV